MHSAEASDWLLYHTLCISRALRNFDIFVLTSLKAPNTIQLTWWQQAPPFMFYNTKRTKGDF